MIILDTHIWLWWINQEINFLGQTRAKLIEQEERIAISAISCFEVAWLESHDRITLPCRREDWFEMALDGSDIELIPITPKIANKTVDLPEHHKDPQDRIIIATALVHEGNLMSMDQKFTLYDELKNILL